MPKTLSLKSTRPKQKQQEEKEPVHRPTLPDNRMDLIDFGKKLIETKDLDPIYVVLYDAKLPQPKLFRWMLSYWCFYNAGTASWISDGYDEGKDKEYWKRMQAAAKSKDYPRGRERRHYRGDLSINSVKWLQKEGIDKLFEPFTVGVTRTVGGIMEYVCTWYGFGGWIAFKVADMLERLKVAPIDFQGGEKHFFNSPIMGAMLAYETYYRPTAKKPHPTQWTIEYLQSSKVGHLMAPPSRNRLIGIQEIETILCKWYAHMTNGYTIGEDIEALAIALRTFPHESPTKRLLQRKGNKAFGAMFTTPLDA